MRIPQARGPVSGWTAQTLRGRSAPPPQIPDNVVRDADTQLALWMIYELTYRGFEDTDADEWHPELVALRTGIERRFETQLRHVTDVPQPADDLAQQLLDLAESAQGPSVARFLQRQATADQMRDYLRERSVQQLKESDPHSFVLGRLDGPAKTALAELQYDEYGSGSAQRLHARLYAEAMTAAGLDPTYGSYLGQVGATTLASANVMSMFALNRRLRAASMGHLAMFEATCSVPCRRIAGGLARLGFPDTVAAYFEEHIEADAVHEHLAARDICANLEAELHTDVLFGAQVCGYLDGLLAEDLLRRWGMAVAS